MPVFPNHLRVYPHVFYVCDGVSCVGRHCRFCEGGLQYCTVCGAFEGELLVNCPGFWLSSEARDACYQGNVVDLCGMLRYLRRTGDGRWVHRKPTEEERNADAR